MAFAPFRLDLGFLDRVEFLVILPFFENIFHVCWTERLKNFFHGNINSSLVAWIRALRARSIYLSKGFRSGCICSLKMFRSTVSWVASASLQVSCFVRCKDFHVTWKVAEEMELSFCLWEVFWQAWVAWRSGSIVSRPLRECQWM